MGGALLLWMGCSNGLLTPYGEQGLQTALWVEESSPSEEVSGVGWLILANSAFTCNPLDEENDPDTETDEAAIAQAWWEASVASAMTREHALVLASRLIAPAGEGFTGDYTMLGDVWFDAPSALLAQEERPGAAGWYWVEEAAAVDPSDLMTAYEPVEMYANLAVAAPGSLSLTETDAGASGEISFEADEISGPFEAARCESPRLLSLIRATRVQLAYGQEEYAL